jgi:hypothetical protein
VLQFRDIRLGEALTLFWRALALRRAGVLLPVLALEDASISLEIGWDAIAALATSEDRFVLFTRFRPGVPPYYWIERRRLSAEVEKTLVTLFAEHGLLGGAATPAP